MRVSVERRALLARLRRLKSAAGVKADLVLTVDFSEFSLTAVSDEIVARVPLDPLGDVEHGRTRLSLRRLVDVVASQSGDEVSLVFGGDRLVVSSGDSVMTLSAGKVPAEGFVPEPAIMSEWREVDAPAFRDAVTAVSTAAATDRHSVFGVVRFESATDYKFTHDERFAVLVASDTFRLIHRAVPLDGSDFLPFSVAFRPLARAVRFLGKKTPTIRWADDSYLWMVAEGQGAVAVAVDRSPFPAWRGWSLLWKSWLSLPREPLLRLVSQVVALDRKNPHIVRLILSAEKVDVFSKGGSGSVSGSLSPTASSKGFERVELRFNSVFLRDALDALTTELAVVKLAEKPHERPKPVFVGESGSDAGFGLIMPMRHS